MQMLNTMNDIKQLKWNQNSVQLLKAETKKNLVVIYFWN